MNRETDSQRNISNTHDKSSYRSVPVFESSRIGPVPSASSRFEKPGKTVAVGNPRGAVSAEQRERGGGREGPGGFHRAVLNLLSIQVVNNIRPVVTTASEPLYTADGSGDRSGNSVLE